MRLKLAAIAAIAAAGLFVGNAQAGTDYWQHDPASPGDWFVADNWSDGIPDITTDTCVQAGTTVVATGTAAVDHLVLAETGDAEMLQSGGSVQIHLRLFLAMTYGVTGTYTMTGGTLTMEENAMYVGRFGQGIVRQTGGSISVHDYLYMGVTGSAYGVYEISGTASLSTPYLYIGSNGSGEFWQAGGTVSVPYIGWGFGGGVELARYYDSRATYDLSGGRLECDYIIVGTGNGAVGEFRQSGGDAIATRFVAVGYSEGTVGTYVLSDTGCLQADQLLIAGEDARGNGTLSVEGAGVTVLVGTYDQGAKGSLISLIDATGLAPVCVTGVASLHGTWTVLSENASLGRFHVLVAEGGLSGNFDSIDLPDADWSWGIDDGKIIWVNHTPEPATLAMLAVSGLGLLARRRRP